MKFNTTNPATEQVIAEYEIMDRTAVDEKVARARKAFESWKETDIGERTRLARKLGRMLMKKKQQLAESITEEMGKPVRQSLSEVEKCASICEYFSRNAKKFLRDEHVKTEFAKSYVSFQSLGVVGSIMPWNFPASQIIRFAVPSMIAGNVQIVKPSSTTPNSGGLLIEQLFKREVPEILNGTVQMKKIVREPGERAKVAVYQLSCSTLVWAFIELFLISLSSWRLNHGHAYGWILARPCGGFGFRRVQARFRARAGDSCGA